MTAFVFAQDKKLHIKKEVNSGGCWELMKTFQETKKTQVAQILIKDIGPFLCLDDQKSNEFCTNRLSNVMHDKFPKD